MALGDVDRGLEGRGYGPIDGKEADEGPEYQSKVYEGTDPKKVEPSNRFAVIDIWAENRKSQFLTPSVPLF